MPSPAARKLLASQTELFHSQIAGPATSYLEGRGIGRRAVDRFQLGFTGPTGDYRAFRLAIPYLTPEGPWHIKYRCIQHADCKAEGCSKYVYDRADAQDVAGQIPVEQRLFNAMTLTDADFVAIVEGEIDTIAGEMAGAPHVGYPGAQAWRAKENRHWRHCFDSADEIVVVADGDIPRDGKKIGVGEEAAREVASDLRKAYPDTLVRVVVHDAGYDTNLFLRENSPLDYMELIGRI